MAKAYAEPGRFIMTTDRTVYTGDRGEFAPISTREIAWLKANGYRVEEDPEVSVEPIVKRSVKRIIKTREDDLAMAEFKEDQAATETHDTPARPMGVTGGGPEHRYA